MNIAPAILPKKIEELREAHLSTSSPICARAVGKSICGYRERRLPFGRFAKRRVADRLRPVAGDA